MSNIDKHAVQAVADLKAGYTLGHADVAILNELARIALASLEAEAVGEVVLGEFDDCGCHPDARVECIAADGQADWENFKDGTRLYTAPPAQVSVPEWTNEQCLEFLSIAFRHAEIKGDLELDDIRLGVKMVNGSRAAMLQGAEPVMTAYKLPFEQWLSQQTGTIDVECGGVMTEVFFHWLRVAYEAGNSPVIPDGWVMVPVDATRAMIDAAARVEEDGYDAMHKAMIVAAPKSGVKCE
ncbi:hypothetical protein [Enterobacter hormaechei]|uniref:hypothetical protein n=1 Tax=Enterobacter hormaechei TaxID=158836 RepID=UPI00057CE879|nr:hypothetical protein [Enterobacter hormaechei]AJB70078.1 hypothetical protein LI64_05710 [Enterobacter hormaechei subsp. hormaechei]KJO04490.1 hypothetical protein SS00_05585 [Enterobacter hormaechei subsp. hormaechei]